MSPQLITLKRDTANRILKHGMAEKDRLRYQLFFLKIDFFDMDHLKNLYEIGYNTDSLDFFFFWL